MNFHDVNVLIDEGEGFRIEFKRRISSPEKIARTLISFANTKGGTILFGVGDDGSIIGVESEKSETELIEMAGRDFATRRFFRTSILFHLMGETSSFVIFLRAK